MKKRIPVIVAILSIVVAAGGFSYGVRARQEKDSILRQAQELRNRLAAKNGESLSREPDKKPEPIVSLKNDAGGTNDIAELQETLAERNAELERLRAEFENRRNNQRESFQDRMARMKEEEPERYAEMVKRRTERQEQMRYDQANRLATLVDMDTSGMTPEELENHNQLVEKMSSIWEMTGEFDPEQPPDREAMRSVFDTMREVNDLMDKERSVMFRQLGTEVGLTGTDAQDFATYAEDIISATTLRMPRGGPR